MIIDAALVNEFILYILSLGLIGAGIMLYVDTKSRVNRAPLQLYSETKTESQQKFRWTSVTQVKRELEREKKERLNYMHKYYELYIAYRELQRRIEDIDDLIDNSK